MQNPSRASQRASVRPLANPHYVDPAVYERERRELLFANWSGIGFAADVPNAGDVKPIDFMGMPLLLVRDHSGDIGVFQNTCRHRGMILVEAPTHIRRVIRCPYHSWCYGLDGSLQATPHVGGPGHNTDAHIHLDDLSLYRIPCAVFLGVVFVNVSATAPAFDDSMAWIRQRWSDFDQPMHLGGESSQTLDLKTNWKLAVENYCESYHLPWIHPGLNSYSKLSDHYNIDEDETCAGQGTRVYRQLEDGRGQRFPDFTGVSTRWHTAAEYLACFPNVLLGVHRDHCFAMILEPRDVNRTVEHLRLFYTEEAAHSDAYRDLRQENLRLWSTVFNEDVSVVEGMQRGRHGVHFDGGRFSSVMDASTAVFHHWVKQQLDQAPPDV